MFCGCSHEGVSSPWEDLLSCGWVLFAKKKGGSRQRQGGSEGSGKVLGSLRSLDSSLMDPGGLQMGELEKGCRYKRGWVGCMPARKGLGAEPECAYYLACSLRAG